MKQMKTPQKQGLYDPQFEHDACGIGAVVNVKGTRSHDIVEQGLTVLLNLDHRGARGSETNTGDGAGILMQIPHKFLKKATANLGFVLPDAGEYAVGMLFLPRDAAVRADCEKMLARFIHEEGQTLLGWRTVPTDNSTLGESAKASQPYIRQIFIAANSELKDTMAFERKLYTIRKRAERAIRYSNMSGTDSFYVASLSTKTIVYKGMLIPEQMKNFYPDLCDKDVESAIALVHSRFSTNTFPSWERAHPNRYLIHNGEINTLRGNVNWMHARESTYKSGVFGEDVSKVLPVVNADGSDSSMFDETLEFMLLTGRSLPHAMMMMIPEPWSKHETMSPARKAFYEYHSCLMEPWDGPAAMAFSDGTIVGAILDRNGLRPARYYVTSDDTVVLASEVGVLDINPQKIIKKGRLKPGRMLLIDTEKQCIVNDEEFKDSLAAEHPYQEWLDKYMITMKDLPDPFEVGGINLETLLQRQKAFGYTYEEMQKVIMPMARDGVEAIGAMGTDIPLAVLSEKPQLLYSYFKQLFAQVTNPPIDALREEIVTGTEVLLGAEGNLLNPQAESCRQLKLNSPILNNRELAKLRSVNQAGLKSVALPILFKVSEGGEGLKAALDELCRQAHRAIDEGANIIILSDRGINRELAGIPALLAVACVHHYLIRARLRTQVSLIVESAEPREVHHFATLIGYGASAINPYLALETVEDLFRKGLLATKDNKKAVAAYIKAAVKGIVKILSKMGISTIQSYQGAQIFEAVGLGQKVIDEYFTGTPSRIEGIGLAEIAEETKLRHEASFASVDNLESGGIYQWRSNGEYHMYNPETIHMIQSACRENNYELYKEYSHKLSGEEHKNVATLRGMLKFKYNRPSVPLDEVESVDEICKRFKTGAMSYGSISREAHECLAIAMNRLGGKSNTGEGGEDPERFIPMENGDSRCSAIKQVASGRFGVTSDYLVNAKEIQIKMAQGAKPGEGGQLPGRKVYPWIARVRHSTPGVGLISPPPHHDIYSIEDLAELIHDLKNANNRARISVKLVSEVGVGTIAAGVAKGRADVILISGFDGGTGAAPRTSIYNAGLPWELGLAETHQTLMLNNLRSRVVIETDGKLMNGRDVAIAALLGAEEFGFATLPLVSLGCAMMRVCNLDTCPVGIATQNPELRKHFAGKPEYVVNLMHFVAQDLREIMAELGYRTINEMIGNADRLEIDQSICNWKTKHLDFSNILYRPEIGSDIAQYHQMPQNHGLEDVMDNRELLGRCQDALETGAKVEIKLPIHNTDRVVGTILGSEVTRKNGRKGLPDDTITLNFTGSAGQSFGAFVPGGITLMLEGDVNDYLGKGLSGGKIIVRPPHEAKFAAEKNIICGNVAFYGATSGEAYVRGIAGERFAVRNSGLKAVVEGIGDHGCEYMTGGCVVVLGRTGRNFAAGMSGGVAYVLDNDGEFASNCNISMVDLERIVDPKEAATVKELITRHRDATDSPLAARILDNWNDVLPDFVKVMPRDYKRVLDAIAELERLGHDREEAFMLAFEENKSDTKRVGGN